MCHFAIVYRAENIPYPFSIIIRSLSRWKNFCEIEEKCLAPSSFMKVLKSAENSNHNDLFGPAFGSYVSRAVSLSVRPSVRHKSSHTSRHYFFLIFCNKLACSKCRKVTKPDFRRKLLNFFYKQFFKK